jgi:hypothetical protein
MLAAVCAVREQGLLAAAYLAVHPAIVAIQQAACAQGLASPVSQASDTGGKRELWIKRGDGM